MGRQIKEVYVIHHSHTDVGYTDLQEQIIYNQANNIRNVVALIKKGYEENSQEKDFKWNCETYKDVYGKECMGVGSRMSKLVYIRIGRFVNFLLYRKRQNP